MSRHLIRMQRFVELKELCPRLAEMQICQVIYAYSGYGDSGEVSEIFARDANGQEVPMDTELEEKLITLLEDFTPAGYEINEGGEGTLTFNVETGEILREHDEFYRESHFSRTLFNEASLDRD